MKCSHDEINTLDCTKHVLVTCAEGSCDRSASRSPSAATHRTSASASLNAALSVSDATREVQHSCVGHLLRSARISAICAGTVSCPADEGSTVALVASCMQGRSSVKHISCQVVQITMWCPNLPVALAELLHGHRDLPRSERCGLARPTCHTQGDRVNGNLRHPPQTQ
jgi:hypothetical protein